MVAVWVRCEEERKLAVWVEDFGFRKDHATSLCGVMIFWPLGDHVVQSANEMDAESVISDSVSDPLAALAAILLLYSPFLLLLHLTMLTRRKMVAPRERKPSQEADDTSRATAERRSKHRADRTPEVHVPQNLDLCRVCGVFKKIMQPRYVDFSSLEDMFEGLEDLFEKQHWLRLVKSQKKYSPTVVTEFFNNLGETITLKPRCAYDITTVNRMGYKMVEGIVRRTLKGQEATEVLRKTKTLKKKTTVRKRNNQKKIWTFLEAMRMYHIFQVNQTFRVHLKFHCLKI
ncbi:hypothetical protein Taro_003379 [Colocasia esculenta]|uniref:Uncharacterized protein n=1 Tax=Colocasia esculenta TaxID=4460 RepID=A0A843TRQ4_COLES|nr:hypothetical protein [Colocasia esculenta]